MNETIEDILKRALDFHVNGETDNASELYRQILGQEPEHTDALHLFGLCEQQAGHIDVALEYISKAVNLAPEFGLYRVNYGVLLQEAGQSADAIGEFRKSIECDPNLPEAYHNLGNALLAEGDVEEALNSFQRACTLRPDYGEPLSNIAHILREKGELDLAVAYLERAANSDAPPPSVFSNLCAAYTEVGRVEEAIASGLRAIEVSSRNAIAHYNLGNAYSRADNALLASNCYREAVVIAPDYADAWCNLGVSLLSQDEPVAALEALDNAIGLQSDSADANWNRALALLTLGRLEEGWAQFDWRWEAVPWLDRRSFNVPQWNGEPLNGETVLIHTEQGYGDTIQFVRYLPEIMKRGGKVRLACQPALKELLSTFAGLEGVSGYGEPPGEFDFHLPIMALPGAIGMKEVATPKEAIPYLSAPISELPIVLDASGPRVGIVWRGSQINKQGMFRSCLLEDFEPILSVDAGQVFALQFDVEAEERELLDQFGAIDLSDHISDFADSAALTAMMDIVISIDTAQVHLAGALGIPIWTLLARGADWRWFLNRTDSPWYPSMRLFRQEVRNDWSVPISHAVDELNSFLSQERQNAR